MIKKILIICFTIILIITVSSCSFHKVSNEITVCLDWTPNTNHTGIYVAIEKGYFEEAGLDVTVVQPDIEMAPSVVASGQAQFGIDAQDTIAEAVLNNETLPVSCVATILQSNTSGIMTRKSDEITSPKYLEEHKYSTFGSEIELAVLKYIVSKDGGDFSTIEIIPNTSTDESAALLNHESDAFWVFHGQGLIHAEESNVETNYFNIADVDDTFNYYTPVIIANNDFLSTHKEESKAFIKALKKGYEYSANNPKESAEILKKCVPEVGEMSYILKSQEYVSGKYLDENGKWGLIDEKRWNCFYKWLYEQKIVENYFDNAGLDLEYING